MWSGLRGHPTAVPKILPTLAWGAFAALACSAPPTSDDSAAAQVAAATEIGRRIARNPGPLETICVAYSGSWDDPPLPAPVEGLAFAYAEGCQEIDGQLFTQASGGRAIWLGVGEPESQGESEAVVRLSRRPAPTTWPPMPVRSTETAGRGRRNAASSRRSADGIPGALRPARLSKRGARMLPFRAPFSARITSFKPV